MKTCKKRKLSKEEKTELLLSNYKLVKNIAYNYSKRCADPVEDLIQVGFIALLEAAENYTEVHNTLFKTYAIHYISGHIRHYLRDKQSIMKGPRSLQELAQKVSLTIKSLTERLGRDPIDKEVSNELDIPAKKLDEVKSYQRNISVVWLDQVINENEDDTKTKLDTIFDIKDDFYSDEIDDKIIVKDALKKLAPSYRELLEMRYFRDMTQIELAGVFGVSQMEVSRKLKKAEKELKALIG